MELQVFFRWCSIIWLALSQATNLDFSKLKDFANDTSKFNENGREFSKRIENTVGKEQFPTVLSTDLYRNKQKQGLVWERVSKWLKNQL